MGSPVAGLVGRSADLALVGGLVGDVVSGRGRCLLIEGEAGIGKSALVAQAVADAEVLGCEVLLGRCDELGGRFPLSVMTRLLGVDERSVDPRRAQAARALRREESADDWSMRPLSGDPVAVAVEQLLVLVDRLCARGPVVLVVEDLHWADEASLVMWRRLCQASVQLPLLTVGTCRPASGQATLNGVRAEVGARDGVVIALGPLSGEAVADLAGRLAGGVAGPRLVQRLAAAAGNPLYVRELLAAVTRVRALELTDGTVELAPGNQAAQAQAQALGSLAEVITDRLDSLSMGAREVLRVAALLGPEFSVEDLGAVAAQEPELANKVAESLRAGVLEEAAGDRLRFRHGLLKEVLYETTPIVLRAALHQHAATALITAGAPVERIAELILPALAVVDGWELDWLADNARHLVDRAPDIAAELLEHALGHTGLTYPRHAVLEAQLAVACHRIGRFERAEELARGMLRTADPERIGQAHWLLGRIAIRLGRRGELARTAWAQPDQRVGDIWHARLLALRAEALCFLGKDDDTAECAAQALALGEQHADPTTMGYALHCLSVLALNRDDAAAAVTSLDRALTVIGTKAQLLELRVTLLGNRMAALDYLRRYQEASQSMGLARSLAERAAVPRLPQLLIQSAEMHFQHGDWDDALLDLEQATGLKEHYLFMRQGMMALIHRRQNNWEQAERYLAALDGQEYPQGWIAGAIYWVLARALAAQRAGRVKESVEVLAVLLTPEYADGVAGRSDYLPGLVRVALAADDHRLAQAAAQACQQDAEGEPQSRIRAFADWCQGLVSADPTLVLAAVDYIRELDQRPNLGNVLEDAAVLQAGAGDVEGARTTLREALAVYSEVGAVWDSQRAVSRLRPSGIVLGVRGPRQRPKTGWGALTMTELRVAEQVASGHSNPDIAEHLLLSRRTVETHVSHILGKLQARSRREVAELARIRG